jgi:hypothetical protein
MTTPEAQTEAQTKAQRPSVSAHGKIFGIISMHEKKWGKLREIAHQCNILQGEILEIALDRLNLEDKELVALLVERGNMVRRGWENASRRNKRALPWLGRVVKKAVVLDDISDLLPGLSDEQLRAVIVRICEFQGFRNAYGTSGIHQQLDSKTEEIKKRMQYLTHAQLRVIYGLVVDMKKQMGEDVEMRKYRIPLRNVWRHADSPSPGTGVK